MAKNVGDRWGKMVQQRSETARFMEICSSSSGRKEGRKQAQSPCQKGGEEGREKSDKKERGINLRLRYAEILNFEPFG